jgi:macrolide transport system ATP-binding/permease protein
MSWWNELNYLIRKLNRRRAEHELEEEIHTHLEMEAQEKIEAGLSPEEARYAARRAFGSAALAKEDSRAMWGFGALEIFWMDLRFAFRRLINSWGFTLIAVLSLALGIGANTAIFSLVNTVLLRPMPVENPERLVALNFASEKSNNIYPLFSYLNYRDLRDRNNVLDGLLAYRMAPVSLSHDGINERAWGYVASGNYFDVLGVKPALGRLLTPEDDKSEGAHPVMVISHECWQRRFAGDPNVVGRSVLVNARSFLIIGVAPRGFHGTEIAYKAEMWFPIMMLGEIVKWGNDLWERGGQSYMVQGRLKPGVNMVQAEASLKAVMAQLAREYPENDGTTTLLSPPGLFGLYIRGPVLSYTGVLMIAAGLVLLLACLNLANLLLARALERRKELAIRLAIGAGRMAIVRQLLSESLLLSLAGGSIGLLLAHWLVNALMAFTPPLDIPVSSTLHIDHRVLIFTLGVSLLTAVIFGLLPALRSSKPDLVPALKDEISAGSSRRSLLASGLVVSQVALSLLLLIGAGLVLRGLLRAERINPGFIPQNAILLSFDLGLQGYDGERSKIFKQQLLERVRALPGVQYAGLADYLPFDIMTRSSNIYAEGGTQERGVDPPSALRGSAGPGFIQAFGARLLQGRDFTTADNATKQKKAIVNETLARRIWQGETAVGKRFSRGSPGGPWIEVIGVIQDGKYQTLSEEGRLFFYTNLEDDQGGSGMSLSLIVRTPNEPQSVIAAIRREFGRLDRNLPIFNVKTMTEHMNSPLFPARVIATLLGSFGLLAMLISAIGLFGVISYAVNRRTHEIGIRLALGAQPWSILRLITGQGLKLTLMGLALGLAGALALTRALSPFLYGISAVDPLTFILISLLLTCVALLACYLPARRAMRVDPLIALRSD